MGRCDFNAKHVKIRTSSKMLLIVSCQLMFTQMQGEHLQRC